MSRYNNAHCFSIEDVGSEVKHLNEKAIEVNGNYMCLTDQQSPSRIITSAHWNSDDTLVVSDAEGNNHYFVGVQRSFTSYKGESEPHDKTGYLRALKECQEIRSKQTDKTAKKNSKKSSQQTSKKKGNLLWRIIKWIFKALLKIFQLIFFFMISKDDSDRK